MLQVVSTKQTRWQKIYRYNHERDFHDVARCLEEADRWIVKREGGDTPESKQVEFSLPEVAAILHLLGSVRRLDTESPALWEFEKRVRASLGEVSAEQINEAVAEHEQSELYEDIERIRKKLPQGVSPISSPQTVPPSTRFLPKSSRYGPGLTASISSRTVSGFSECSRLSAKSQLK